MKIASEKNIYSMFSTVFSKSIELLERNIPKCFKNQKSRRLFIREEVLSEKWCEGEQRENRHEVKGKYDFKHLLCADSALGSHV